MEAVVTPVPSRALGVWELPSQEAWMQELFSNVLNILRADKLGAFTLLPNPATPTPLLLPGNSL